MEQTSSEISLAASDHVQQLLATLHGDSDNLPRADRPAPISRERFAPDPALFVTPEKLAKVSHTAHQIPLRCTSLLEDETDRVKDDSTRVRFNSLVDVQELSPGTPESSIDTQQAMDMQNYSLEAIQQEIIKLAALPSHYQNAQCATHPVPSNSAFQSFRNGELMSGSNRTSDVLHYTYPVSNFLRGTSGALQTQNTVESVYKSQTGSTAITEDSRLSSPPRTAKPSSSTTPPKAPRDKTAAFAERCNKASPPRKGIPYAQSSFSSKSPPKNASPNSSTKSTSPRNFRSVGTANHNDYAEETEECAEATVEREPTFRVNAGHHVWANRYTPEMDGDIQIETILPKECGVLGERTNRHKPQSVPVKIGDTGECVLKRPEFNSSLWMNADLQQLKNSQLNVPAAVQEKLQHPNTRAKVTEKVQTRLNVRNMMFPSDGLVGVDVVEEDFVKKTARQRASKTKQTHRRDVKKPEANLAREPDLLEFFTPDLQKETPCLILRSSETQNPRPIGLSTAPLERTFDLYKHIRAWEGW